MTTLNNYIIRQSRAPKSQAVRQSVREEAGDISVMRSLGLDAASLALPAGTSGQNESVLEAARRISVQRRACHGAVLAPKILAVLRLVISSTP